VLQTPEGHSALVEYVVLWSDSNMADLLFVLNNWVVEGKTKLLWFPSEYRPTSIAIYNRFTVLAHSSGGISILGFNAAAKIYAIMRVSAFQNFFQGATLPVVRLALVYLTHNNFMWVDFVNICELRQYDYSADLIRGTYNIWYL
jgi:hypothetical protein